MLEINKNKENAESSQDAKATTPSQQHVIETPIRLFYLKQKNKINHRNIK